jgi:hypothetical protein
MLNGEAAILGSQPRDSLSGVAAGAIVPEFSRTGIVDGF